MGVQLYQPGGGGPTGNDVYVGTAESQNMGCTGGPGGNESGPWTPIPVTHVL